MSEIVAVFSSIPDVIWAAVIASGLTFLGVTLANRANRKCLILQLNYDAQQKEKERKMSLRRDVYLSAIAKIGQQLQYLSDFYNTEKSSPEGYTEAIGQIDIIGSNETIVAINQFNDHMVEAFVELIPKKEEINLLKERTNLLSETAKQSMEIGEAIKQLKTLYDKKIELTYELADKCQQKAQRAEELLVPVIVAIRKELDTPFDEDAYRAMMKISHKKWKEEIEKYITSMKDSYRQGMQTLLKDFNPPANNPQKRSDKEV